MARLRLEKVGMLFWLAGCAAAPPPCPEPPEPEPAVGLLEPGPDLPRAMAQALVSAGHTCAPSDADPAVQICDRDVAGRATLVLVYADGVAHLASHYRRKPDKTCAEAVPVLNQLNLAVDAVKLVCVEDRVTFVTSMLVPENGLSERSFTEHSERFQGQIKLLLSEGKLLPLLE